MKTVMKSQWFFQSILGRCLQLGLLLTLSATAQSAPRPRPDFNGDGRADLAVGVPGQDVGEYADVGAVQVIFGVPAGGLRPDFKNQIFGPAHCSWPPDGNVSGNGPDMRFGSALAWGDFNGDGFDDLAVGLPGYNPPYPPDGMPEAGMVYVLKGSPAGLILNQTQYFVSTNIGPPLNVNQDEGDRFGAALAAGDFNGDGRDDLAIGAAGQDGWDGANVIADAGEVYVLYGRAWGLERTTAQGWSQNGRTLWPDIMDQPHVGDQFGAALATGDFNGDGRADLAIGVPGEAGGSGAVNVIYGWGNGLEANIPVMNQFWHQDSPGIQGVRAADENFGFSLATGDFNGDGKSDLAVGAPRTTVAAQALAGEVNVLYGSPVGLHAAAGLGNQLWNQSSPGIPDSGFFAGDFFGWNLAAGDFNGDGKSDLAVGVPKDDPSGVESAGAVNIIYGSGNGLNAFGPIASQFWHQNSPGILDVSEPHDWFGRYLTTGDFDADGRADLVIGATGEDIAGIADCGAINVIYGSPLGIHSAGGPGNQFFHQDSPFMPDFCEPGDGFGAR